MTLTPGWNHHHGQWLWYCCMRQEVGRHPSTQLLHPLCPIATLALQFQEFWGYTGHEGVSSYLWIQRFFQTMTSIWEVSVVRAYLMIFFREFPTKSVRREDVTWCDTIKHSTLVRKFSHSTLKNLIQIVGIVGSLSYVSWRLLDVKLLKSPLFLLSDSRGFSCCRDGEDTKAFGGPVFSVLSPSNGTGSWV